MKCGYRFWNEASFCSGVWCKVSGRREHKLYETDPGNVNFYTACNTLMYETDPGHFHFSTQCNTCLWMDIVHAASRVWRPQGDCVNEREAVKKCLWMRSPWPATTSYSDEKSLWMSSHTSFSYPDTSAQPKADQRMPGSIWIRWTCWWGGWQISLALKLRKETQNKSNLWCSLERIPLTWIWNLRAVFAVLKAEKLETDPDLMAGSLHAGDCDESLTAPDFHQRSQEEVDTKTG